MASSRPHFELVSNVGKMATFRKSMDNQFLPD
jgi:hypothetical protein